MARPRGGVDAAREEDDDEEASGEGDPDEAAEDLGDLRADEAGEDEGVEDEHDARDGLGDEAKVHCADARHLEAVAPEEGHRVLEVVGRDDVRDGADDHLGAKVVEEVGQGRASAHRPP